MRKEAKQNRKRLLSFLLTGCMVASLTPTAFAASATDFTDVAATEWYYSPVDYVVKQGYFAGTSATTFSPAASMTRGMFVTVLARFDGAEVDNTKTTTFADVAAGEWYTGAVAWAVENGLVSGMSESSFAPNQSVTRQQMAAILAKYIAYYKEKNGTTLAENGSVKTFTDAAQIDAYAKDAVALCCGYGIISGYPDGSFGPTGTSTRAQVASVIQRLQKLLTGGEEADSDKETEDKKTEEQKTEDKTTGGGSGGGSSDSSDSGSKKSNLTAKTAADFEKAAEVARKTVTATVEGDNSLTVNDDITIDNNSVTVLTLDLGNASLGDLTVNAAKAVKITITGTGSVQSLTINAPNASVTNSVTVNDGVNIVEVSQNTFNNKAKTGIITLSGSGAVNDTQETPAQIVVNTGYPVTVKGNSTAIQVVADEAKVTVATEVAPKVESAATQVAVTIATEQQVKLAGTIGEVEAAETATPNLKVEGTIGKIYAHGGTSLAIAGSGTIGSIELGNAGKEAAVTIANDANVSVETISAQGDSTINAPANTINTVDAGANVTLNAPVQTVTTRAKDVTLTLGETAKVQTIEANGSLTLGGSGEVTSIDVQGSEAATIAVSAGANVAVTQITKTEANEGGVTVSGLEDVKVVTKAAKPAVEGVPPTAAGGQGKITGVTIAMEYKSGTSTNWTAVTSPEGGKISVNEGTYQVRVKATDTALASDAVTVTIPAAVGVSSAEIQGTAYVGQTLTAVANADATGEITYEWKAGDSVIENATAKTLLLTDEMIGKTITVRIYNYEGTTESGTNQDTATSTQTKAVTVDKTALNKLIAKAAEVQQGVTANDNDESAVPKGVRFVTNNVQTALTDAKTAAQAVNINSATTAQVSEQEKALRAAIDTYEKAIQIGTLDEVEKLKTALGTLITTATGIKVDEKYINTDAKNVTPGTQWVTSEVQATYTAAIETATKVKDNNSATATELADAIATLNGAISDYIKAIQKGAALDDSALVAAINAANINAASVAVSKDGKDVLPSNNWVTENDKNTYTGAIATAKGVITKTTSTTTTSTTTQSVYDTALTTLNGATTTFNDAKRAGKADIIAPVVTNVNATLNGTTATISFTTNEPGSYKVNNATPVEINAVGTVSFAVTGYDTEKKPAITVTVMDASGNATTFTVVPTSKVVQVGENTYETLAAAVAAAKDEDTIKLLKDVTLSTTDYYVSKKDTDKSTDSNTVYLPDKRLEVMQDNLTIDLNGKTLTAPNCVLTIKGDGVTLKNGTMVATTISSSQTRGSYVAQIWGKNVTVEDLVTTGGINVSGYNSAATDVPDATVTVKNCDITATNFYTVCAQRNAAVTVENSTLRFGNYGFFWAEIKDYSEGDDTPANVNAKIAYDTDTKLVGTGNLYNTVGVAPVITGLTVDGVEGTIEADVVLIERDLKDAIQNGRNVVLAADITTEGVTVADGKKVILYLNGKTLKGQNSDTITVALGGELFVTGDGTVDNITHGKAAIYNNGTVTLNDGSYTRSQEKGTDKETSGGNSYYNILNHGIMTINEGVSVTSTGAFSSLIANGYYNYGKSTNERIGYVDRTNQAAPSLTINGGTFSGGINTIKNDDGATLVINAGEFANTTQAVVQNNNIATINGGTFSPTNGFDAVQNRHFDGEYNKGQITIADGVFNGNLLTTDGATWSIIGGTFSADPTNYVAEGYVATKNDDDTWTVSEGTTETNAIALNSLDAEDETNAVETASLDGDDEANTNNTNENNADETVVKEVVENNEENSAGESTAA